LSKNPRLSRPFRITRESSSYPCKGWIDIETLDLLAPQPGRDIYELYWPSRTSAALYTPARIVDFAFDFTRKGAAEYSLISQGCAVSGGRLDRSALSPSVTVHLGAHVSECILTERVVVMPEEYAW
jgi:glucose-1-phosphate adenylyltransferase